MSPKPNPKGQQHLKIRKIVERAKEIEEEWHWGRQKTSFHSESLEFYDPASKLPIIAPWACLLTFCSSTQWSKISNPSEITLSVQVYQTGNIRFNFFNYLYVVNFNFICRVQIMSQSSHIILLIDSAPWLFNRISNIFP